MTAKPLTEPQRKALHSAIVHGSPTAHLDGQSAWGGWGGTRVALMGRGYLDTACRITASGRKAMGCPCPKPEATDPEIEISCPFHGKRDRKGSQI